MSVAPNLQSRSDLKAAIQKSHDEGRSAVPDRCADCADNVTIWSANRHRYMVQAPLPVQQRAPEPAARFSEREV